MGILNLTPDSFSDGGDYFELDKAIAHLDLMISSGANIVDLGAESTRYGSFELDTKEEIKRVEPILKYISQKHPQMQVSLDTRHSQTAQMATQYGICYINDISALRHDPQMTRLLRQHPKLKIIIMHMQGQPHNMQDAPHYDDLFGEIQDFFTQRISFCQAQGISKDRLILDPGIGFGKTKEHNLMLIAGLQKLSNFGLPLAIGASRKSFINDIFTSNAKDRLAGSLAAAFVSALNKVEIIRVHDVFEHAQFFAVINALLEVES